VAADPPSSADQAPPGSTERARSLVLLGGGIVALASFATIGTVYTPYHFDLGYANAIGPGTASFLLPWLVLGLAGTLAIAAALTRLQGGWSIRIGRAWRAGPDWAWIAGFAVIALIIPLVIRSLVLHGAPVVDDESSYRYSAELLARGHLVGDSPPMRLAFDRSFMVNDGRFYSQYFLGWPALMVPGVWASWPGAMNAVYGALALPALFFVVRRVAGASTARVAGLLYVTSPMLAIGAATEMAHTSCFAALMWLAWCVLRADDDDDDAPVWVHAAVGAAFSIAFLIRPTSAIGAGLPLVAWWLIGTWRRGGAARWRALTACAVPTLAFAAAFLAINQLQNGSPMRTAYTAAVDYARANGFRFTHWTAGNIGLETAWWGWPHALANTGLATIRFDAALFGWPCSLILIPFAWGAPRARLFWASLGWFVAFHALVKNIGVDVFGPVHYFELAVPLLVLSAIGLARAGDVCGRIGDALGARARWGAAPAIAVGVFVAASLALYTPRQLATIGESSGMIASVLAAPDAVPGPVVVFAPHPLLRPECARTWVMWRPNNDPDLANRVLWANHITVERDREVVARFPGRTGYILDVSKRCEGTLIPLAGLAADAVPPGNVGGTRSID